MEMETHPCVPVAERLAEVLRRTWGYPSFRPLQREAMEAVLAGRDSLLVLPTGGGKSLCFQAPALVASGPDGGAEPEGLALVVSPLISLMKDQVDALRAAGVPAAALHSAMAPEEKSEVLSGLPRGAYRLLYVSPERLAGEGFLGRLAGCRVRFVAIDEAHCISQWGHDFRPEYRRLGELREALPGISVHAFTATATERVRRDIVDELRLRDPTVLVGSFDRPNLTYRSTPRTDLSAQLRGVLERHAGEAGIVYCLSRKKVESLASRLASWGYRALPYHAGLDDAVRARHQDDFIHERADVVVATVAFGMGIDRSNVRFVVHAAAPRSLEHYQQEAGRAGRDALPADCVLLHSPGDFATWRRLLERSGELTPAGRRLLSEMERYAAGTHCRHRHLVEYFGQPWERGSCGACDWCLGELETVDEPLVLAQKILSCVARVRESFGASHVVDVLRGRETEKVLSRGHDELSTFALLEELPVAELRAYLDQLVSHGYLLQEGDRYPVLRLTGEGWRVLRGEETPTLVRQPRPPRRSRRGEKRARAEGESWEGVDRELFEALRRLRTEIARERGVPPYVVFHDSVLRELARLEPATEAELLEIHGIGEKKAHDLGPRFLAVIAAHGSGGEGDGSEQEAPGSNDPSPEAPWTVN